LELKRGLPDTSVKLLSLGGPESENSIREAWARGCDDVARLWEEDLAFVRQPGRALVLAAAARAFGYDLILLGSAGPADPGRQLAEILAAKLEVPCVGQALSLAAPPQQPGWLDVSRSLQGGFTEILGVRLPAVIGVSGQGGEERAPLPALVSVHQSPVRVWDLTDVGLPWEEVRQEESRLRYGAWQQPQPALRRAGPFDSSLPAFERIQQLLQGSTSRREGRISRGSADELSDEVFRTLLREGWLDHLRPGSRETAEGSRE
jgi:electron transfer flavoprotein alpha/beta subunit